CPRRRRSTRRWRPPAACASASACESGPSSSTACTRPSPASMASMPAPTDWPASLRARARPWWRRPTSGGRARSSSANSSAGARPGRRAVVVTIAPAKRLADALGLESLSDTPTRIEGDWPGELWALMLDTKSTFDALVLKYAPSPDQAGGILRNRFYRNISSALSGTQEYMAMEKLYELHEEGGFELVVVDTPPTRNALDFIDAPRRLTRFLDNRLFRWLMMPTRAYL